MPYLNGAPEPLRFYRDWIGANKPCIIRDAFSHWPALSRWTPEYLRSVKEALGDFYLKKITMFIYPKLKPSLIRTDQNLNKVQSQRC